MKTNLLLYVLLLSVGFVYSQNDCSTPLIVCGNTGFSNIEVSGPGTQELIGSNSCASQEHNSLWLDVTIKTSGTLAFTLKPESSNIEEDFDFFIFGPDVSCNNIGQAIRCSTTNPKAAGQSNNHTGLSVNEVDTSEGPGVDGNSFVSAINANAGERYFIVIDRPIGSSNFSLDWTGTATFNDPPSADIPTGKTIDIEDCDKVAPYTDGLSEFDLTQNDFIIGSQSNVAISYHINNVDANVGDNEIKDPDSYINTINNQTIYARLENTVTGCYNVSSFMLKVNSGPDLETFNLQECDVNNDGFTLFNLSLINNSVLDSGNVADYNFTYYLSQADAESGSNTVQLPVNYTNTKINQQELFVRVENKTNAFCSNIISFNITAKETPTINDVVELKQCDNDTDALTLFNLEEANAKISTNHLNETITYFESLTAAQNGGKSIASPTVYQNKIPSTDKVWARITNSNDCSKIAEINLVVSTTSIPNTFLRRINTCDDLANNKDGVTTFDFSSVNTDIINMFSATGQQITISYYESEADALAEQNAISDISNHRNTNSPFQQNIYVRVDSNLDNACLGLGHHVTLEVDPVPTYDLLGDNELCFNTTTTLSVNNVVPNSVNYEWFKDGNPQVIGNTNELEIASGGLYKVRVTNTITQCYEVKQIQVTEVSGPSVTKEDIIIVDDLNSTNGNYSITVEGNFPVEAYEYSLIHPSGNQTRFQDSPLFDNLFGGKYRLIVRDKNNCKPDVFLDVFVLQFPKFFTPNDDGVNDVWEIIGLDTSFFKEGDFIVYDRYGKKLYKSSVFGLGWNGFYKGSRLSNNDYWFSVNLIDINDKVYNHKGHFSLLTKQL